MCLFQSIKFFRVDGHEWTVNVKIQLSDIKIMHFRLYYEIYGANEVVKSKYFTSEPITNCSQTKFVVILLVVWSF